MPIMQSKQKGKECNGAETTHKANNSQMSEFAKRAKTRNKAKKDKKRKEII